ncbi:NADH:ubiquinone oxidoreductase [bacterium]|nr:NADH:ubiquinone oxidoreductase [bacterium]
MKPKVAFFSFTSCEGCQLTVLECEDILLDMLGQIEIVRFREASSLKRDDYEIAFIEGSASRPDDVTRMRKIRERANLVVAIGACAVSGGVNFMKNFHYLQRTREHVYGAQADWFPTTQVQPVEAVIKVDHSVYGCPMTKDEFLETVKSLLVGRTPRIPQYPVCVECKMAENVCLFHRGQTCLGPVIRAGCQAFCPGLGAGCDGCRGLAPDHNLASLTNVLGEYGMKPEEVRRKLRLFNGYIEVQP